MWTINIYTDQKTAIRANFYPFLPRVSRRALAYWHARYVRLSAGITRYAMRPRWSPLRVRLRKARGYYAHTARRIRAGLTQKPARPYVRCSLLTDLLL